MRILFDSKNTDFKKPFGPLKILEKCNFNIHIPKTCAVVTVDVIFYKSDSEGNFNENLRVPMNLSSFYGGYNIFSCEFSLYEPGLYQYNFFIREENTEYSLYKSGYSDTNIGVGEMWQLSAIPADFSVPDWYAGKIMYQIFPDRFNKSGNPDLTGKITPYTIHKNLSDVPIVNNDDDPKNKNNDFFGGNLMGIIKKLPYLKSLNVSVIYLNPIFKAHSNHRYDTADYMKIDEMLGTEDDFKDLCDTAHGLGIKIIIDGVFSHTGAESVYFDIDGKFGNGAYKNPSSPYAKWFQFDENSQYGYNCWWGVPTLPCTNELCPEFQDFILNKVLVKWFSCGADGIRLDVADELPDEFIKKLRTKVKSLNPDALVIGEVWEDASNKMSYGRRREYFTGCELDSVMNYPFRDAIIDFINGNISSYDFVDRIMTIVENYPQDVLLSLMNILSTHDTPRIFTVLTDNKDCDSNDKLVYRKLYAAVCMQYLLPGMPCIYYGDEICMKGSGDPYCRGYFEWDKTDLFFAVFKSLGFLHRNYKVLTFGTTSCYSDKPGLVTIVRSYDNLILRATFSLLDEPTDLNVIGNVLLDNGYVNGRISKYGFVVTLSEI